MIPRVSGNVNSFMLSMNDYLDDTCDTTHILDLFATLTNAKKKAQVILPESLADIERLIDMRDIVPRNHDWAATAVPELRGTGQRHG